MPHDISAILSVRRIQFGIQSTRPSVTKREKKFPVFTGVFLFLFYTSDLEEGL